MGLPQGMARLRKMAQRIDSVQERNGLQTGTQEEMLLQFELIEAVLDWARGMVSVLLRRPGAARR